MSTLPRFALALTLAAVAVSPASAQQSPSPKMRAEAQAIAAACRADYLQRCPGVQPGGGRILACLRSVAVEKLSPDCRAALPRAEMLKTQAEAAHAMPQ